VRNPARFCFDTNLRGNLPSNTTSLITREPVEKSFSERFLVDKSRSRLRFLPLFDPNSRNIRRHFLPIYRLSRGP